VTESRIGGDPARGAANVVAGFFNAQIQANFVTDTSFLGNRIGTNPAGTALLNGGGMTGLDVNEGGNNAIGGAGCRQCRRRPVGRDRPAEQRRQPRAGQPDRNQRRG
jgi:hypothetical protein